MATLAGLFQRSNAYYLRVVLPLHHLLRNKYKNRELVTSLGCRSYREAMHKGTISSGLKFCGGILAQCLLDSQGLA